MFELSAADVLPLSKRVDCITHVDWTGSSTAFVAKLFCVRGTTLAADQKMQRLCHQLSIAIADARPKISAAPGVQLRTPREIKRTDNVL